VAELKVAKEDKNGGIHRRFDISKGFVNNPEYIVRERMSRIKI